MNRVVPVVAMALLAGGCHQARRLSPERPAVPSRVERSALTTPVTFAAHETGQEQEASSPDALEQAARLHGQVEGHLQTIHREIRELGAARELGVPIRPWSLEQYQAASGMRAPILERGKRAQEMVEAGLAEEGLEEWESTVFEHAIDGEVITSQADQERFFAIAEKERQGVVVRWAAWRAVEMALAFTPLRGAGAGGELFARAPQSTSAALAALNAAVRKTGIRGQFVNVVESMSARAIRFQEAVTGIRAGTSFLRGGVKFDYFDTVRRFLVEAKGPGYANFVNKSGEFYIWFRGRNALVKQAERQLKAADGEKVVWVFAEQRALDATRRLFVGEAKNELLREALKSGQLTLRVHKPETTSQHVALLELWMVSAHGR